VFEVGVVLTGNQAAKAVKAIDLDNSGEIDFTEFAIWWLCPKNQDSDVKAPTFDTKALKAKLELYRQVRKTRRAVTELSKSVETKVKGRLVRHNE